MININQSIPDFTLDAFYQDKIKKINFSDYQGKWLLLLFYPADFTFICPTELTEAQRLYGDFQAENAEIVSVSTDSIYVHMAWHEHSPQIAKIKYPMLADPGGKVSRAFGTYIEDEGISQRASFIINPDGELVAWEMHDNSIGRNIQELLRKLQAAKFTRENKDQGLVCPVNWQPGDKGVKTNV